MVIFNSYVTNYQRVSSICMLGVGLLTKLVAVLPRVWVSRKDKRWVGLMIAHMGVPRNRRFPARFMAIAKEDKLLNHRPLRFSSIFPSNPNGWFYYYYYYYYHHHHHYYYYCYHYYYHYYYYYYYYYYYHYYYYSNRTHYYCHKLLLCSITTIIIVTIIICDAIRT